MNWYIGQPIVAIRTDVNQAGVVKGKEYSIQGLRGRACKCSFAPILIDVGISYAPNRGKNPYYFTCGGCGTTDIETFGKRWYSPRYFAPLDVNISELTEILENANTVTA